MRILYLSLSYLPSRRASSVQVMKMSAALAGLGHDVLLVGKAGDEPGEGGLHQFYGVPPGFEVERLPRPAWRGGGALYASRVAAILLRHRRWADLVYCRDLIGAAAAAELALPVVYEAHSIPAGRWRQHLLRRILAAPSTVGLVAISQALANDLTAAKLVPRGRPVVVAHDAADIPDVDAGARTDSDPDRPRIGYDRSLYPGRGVDVVIELARRFPDLPFEVIGGTAPDLARWRSQHLPPNLDMVGFVPPGKLPGRYRRLDVLLMPYPREGIRGPTASGDTSRWCSPMKMFEYMAAGAAVVSSDLPVLQEVLRHEHNALIVAASDLEAWAKAIERLRADPSLRGRLGGQALADLRANHTWPARAAMILQEMGRQAARPS